MFILLLGAFFPKTEEGTMVGTSIAPAEAAIELLKKILRFITV
jgi:hypothetical protein